VPAVFERCCTSVPSFVTAIYNHSVSVAQHTGFEVGFAVSVRGIVTLQRPRRYLVVPSVEDSTVQTVSVHNWGAGFVVHMFV
jgi:hypothetical protein